MGLLDADGLLTGLLSRIDAMKRRGADILRNPRDTLLSGYGFGPEFGAGPSQEYRTQEQMGLLGSVFPEVQQAGRDAALAHQREQYATMLDVGLNAPGLLGHIVYHGSPHTFDKFDMAKIGTGEGAQAYGHGLYFAENPEVAKSYQEGLTGSPSFSIGSRNVGKASTSETADAARMLWQSGGNADEALAYANKLATAKNPIYPYTSKNYMERLTRAIRENAGKDIKPSESGALYKVDIPDEAVARMLDWDAPLSQQPHILDKINASGRLRTSDEPAFTALQQAQRNRYYAADLFNGGQGELGPLTPAEMAERLRSAGIPGIKYYDAGSRANGGTRNMVLFDAELAKILERNGIPLP